MPGAVTHQLQRFPGGCPGMMKEVDVVGMTSWVVTHSVTLTVNVRPEVGVVLPQTTSHWSVTGCPAGVSPHGEGLIGRMNGVGGSSETSQFGSRTGWLLSSQPAEL